MRALLLLGLCGCDVVYGLTGRKEGDAGVQGDAPLGDADVDDAASGCPTSGPPAFTSAHILLVSGCTDYTTSSATGMALMTCNGVLFEGPIDSSSILPSMINQPIDQVLDDPRLSPSGDELLVTSRGTATKEIAVYRKMGRWVLQNPPSGRPIDTLTNVLFASPPSAGTVRRIFVHQMFGNVPVFAEYEDDGNDTWASRQQYSPGELGVSAFAHPSLSPDGRHLVFIGNPSADGSGEVRYAYRPNRNAKFDDSVRIEIGPMNNAEYPHLAPDCSRLYFSVDNNVVYVQ